MHVLCWKIQVCSNFMTQLYIQYVGIEPMPFRYRLPLLYPQIHFRCMAGFTFQHTLNRVDFEYLTVYDVDSIMNYCNPVTNQLHLSSGMFDLGTLSSECLF